jgi:energy-converting hydrogenase Eha subunit G
MSFDRLGKLLPPILAVIVTPVALVAFADRHGIVPILEAEASLVLAGVAWASWIGFRQNHGRNDEWPLNLAILALAIVGIALLMRSIAA